MEVDQLNKKTLVEERSLFKFSHCPFADLRHQVRKYSYKASNLYNKLVYIEFYSIKLLK
jgi:hypothetical protein